MDGSTESFAARFVQSGWRVGVLRCFAITLDTQQRQGGRGARPHTPSPCAHASLDRRPLQRGNRARRAVDLRWRGARRSVSSTINDIVIFWKILITTKSSISDSETPITSPRAGARAGTTSPSAGHVARLSARQGARRHLQRLAVPRRDARVGGCEGLDDAVPNLNKSIET
jgi:hypothetical protein